MCLGGPLDSQTAVHRCMYHMLHICVWSARKNRTREAKNKKSKRSAGGTKTIDPRYTWRNRVRQATDQPISTRYTDMRSRSFCSGSKLYSTPIIIFLVLLYSTYIASRVHATFLVGGEVGQLSKQWSRQLVKCPSPHDERDMRSRYPFARYDDVSWWTT